MKMIGQFGLERKWGGLANVNQRLDSMDGRLRTVETGISELKGKQGELQS